MPTRDAGEPRSPRLAYTRIGPGLTDAFHRLLVDPHVRRYLLDGEEVSRAWARQAAGDSERLFAEHGVGLWLLRERAAPHGSPIGFAGFRVFPAMDPAPQLLYALVERATGRGHATEAARALLAFAADPAGPGLAEVPAAVDAPNRASARVLEKLGFVRTGEAPGAFGSTLLYRWRRPS